MSSALHNTITLTAQQFFSLESRSNGQLFVVDCAGDTRPIPLDRLFFYFPCAVVLTVKNSTEIVGSGNTQYDIEELEVAVQSLFLQTRGSIKDAFHFLSRNSSNCELLENLFLISDADVSSNDIIPPMGVDTLTVCCPKFHVDSCLVDEDLYCFGLMTSNIDYLMDQLPTMLEGCHGIRTLTFGYKGELEISEDIIVEKDILMPYFRVDIGQWYSRLETLADIMAPSAFFHITDVHPEHDMREEESEIFFAFKNCSKEAYEFLGRCFPNVTELSLTSSTVPRGFINAFPKVEHCMLSRSWLGNGGEAMKTHGNLKKLSLDHATMPIEVIQRTIDKCATIESILISEHVFSLSGPNRDVILDCSNLELAHVSFANIYWSKIDPTHKMNIRIVVEDQVFEDCEPERSSTFTVKCKNSKRICINRKELR